MSKQRCSDQIKNLVAGSEKKSCMPKIGVCSVLLSEPIHTYLIIKHTHTFFFTTLSLSCRHTCSLLIFGREEKRSEVIRNSDYTKFSNQRQGFKNMNRCPLTICVALSPSLLCAAGAEGKQLTFFVLCFLFFFLLFIGFKKWGNSTEMQQNREGRGAPWRESGRKK